MLPTTDVTTVIITSVVARARKVSCRGGATQGWGYEKPRARKQGPRRRTCLSPF